MSRRHHHHMQPYDYERFTDHSRDRDQARGIEYQDDSLSSINSDEDSYLHHHPHKQDKKLPYYNAKTESSNKSKPEKQGESHHQKEVKQLQTTTNNHPDNTSERLGRLESLLEELIKRNTTVHQTPQVPEKVVDNRSAQINLEGKRNKFTTSLWINKIQEMSVQNNWDEKTTIQFMESQMTGIIKAWYNCLANYDYTWPEWKMLISQVFPDNVDFVTTLKRLVTRLKKVDENVTSYYFSKMYLIEACKITGEDAVSCLIDGLNNQAIQEKAKSQNFVTPEMLYSQFLMNLPEYTVDYSPTLDPAIPQAQAGVWDQWYYQQQQQQQEQQEAEEEAREEKAGPSEDQYQYGNAEQNEEESYHDDDHFGYSANEDNPHSMSVQGKRQGPVHARLDKRFIKPNQFKQNKIPLAAKVCIICKHRGHIAKHCRKRNILYCKLKGKETKSCFFKDCIINGLKMDAFVDTGCNTVAIRAQEACALGLNVYPTSDFIEVYGGGRVDILGETEVLLELDSVKRRVRVTVVPNNAQDIAVIVGQSFLTQKNVCVFLQNETLKVLEAPQSPVINQNNFNVSFW